MQRIILAKLIIAIILGLIGASLRVVVVTSTVVNGPLRTDAYEYFLSGYNLYHHGTYSRSRSVLTNPPQPIVADAYRPPGLPLVLAAFMGKWPDYHSIIRSTQYLNIVLGTLATLAIFFSAATVLPLLGATLVGLLVAVWPHLISSTVYVLTEAPAAFLVAALFFLASLAEPKTRTPAWLALALGICVGGLSLFKPVLLGFVPFIALAFPGQARRTLAYACLGAAIIVAPWFIRAFFLLPDSPVPNLMNSTMIEGAYRGYVFNADPSTFPYGGRFDPRWQEARQSLASSLGIVVDRILDDPLGMAWWYFIEKPSFLYRWSNIDGSGDVFIYPVAASPFRDNPLFMSLHGILHWIYPVILALGLIGSLSAWHPSAANYSSPRLLMIHRLAAAFLIYNYLAHLPFFSAGRYNWPTLPVLILLAILTIALLWRWTRARFGPQPQAD